MHPDFGCVTPNVCGNLKPQALEPVLPQQDGPADAPLLASSSRRRDPYDPWGLKVPPEGNAKAAPSTGTIKIGLYALVQVSETHNGDLATIEPPWGPEGAQVCEVAVDEAVHCVRCKLMHYIICDNQIRRPYPSVVVIDDSAKASRYHSRVNTCTCSNFFKCFDLDGRLFAHKCVHRDRMSIKVVLPSVLNFYLSMKPSFVKGLSHLLLTPQDDPDVCLARAMRAKITEIEHYDVESKQLKIGYVRKGRTWRARSGYELAPGGSYTRRAERKRAHDARMVAAADKAAETGNDEFFATLDRVSAHMAAIGMPDAGAEGRLQPDGTLKYGDNTVSGEGFVELALGTAGYPTDATTFEWLVGAMRTPRDNVVYDDLYVTVKGMVQVNDKSGAYLPIHQEYNWIRWVPIEAAIEPLKVSYDRGLEIGQLDRDILNAFMVGNAVDANKIARTWPAISFINAQLLLKIAPLITINLTRVSNVALYAKGHLIWLILLEAERRQAQVTFTGRPNDWITAINTNPAANEVDNSANAINISTDRGDFMLNGRETTDVDWNCAALLGTPLPNMTVTVQETELRATHIEFPGIRFRVLSADNHRRPVFAIPTAAAFRAFLHKFACGRGEQADYVFALPRALCLFNTHELFSQATVEASGLITKVDNASWFCQPTFEVGTTSFTKPRDWNWMWRNAGLQNARTTWPDVSQEISSISSATPNQLDSACVLYASIISLSASTLCEKMQLDPTDLNAQWVPTLTGGVTTMHMQGLFSNTSLTPSDAIVWIRLVATVFGLCLPSAMAAQGWMQCQWQPRTEVPVNIDLTNLWCRNSTWHIPYFITPIMMANWLVTWIDIWGIMSHNVSLNTADDLIISGSEAETCWDAATGSARYETIFASLTPYDYVAYGAFVINTLLQRHRRGTLWQWRMAKWVRTTNRVRFVGHSGEYVPELVNNVAPLLAFGTLRTWIRSREIGYSPSIRGNVFSRSEWASIMSRGAQGIDNAGIMLPRNIVDTPRGQDISSFMSFLGVHGNTEPAGHLAVERVASSAAESQVPAQQTVSGGASSLSPPPVMANNQAASASEPGNV